MGHIREGGEAKMRTLINRRCGVCSGLIFFFLLNGTVFSQSYKSLYPCFIDLPGWEAEEVSGMDPDDWVITTGAKRDLITATRDYEKGDKSLSVVIQVGPGIAALYADMEESESNSDGMHVTVKKIKGHQAHISCHREDETNCCDIRIVLFSHKESGALLMFVSEGLTEKEALEIAQKFDWDLMTEKAKSLKFHSQ
jgi:hypothetical protein